MPIRVVIAEDEAIIRLDLKETLEEEGYLVVGETGRGDEAVELVREHEPDIAILDIKMPGLDGLSAAREIAGERLAAVLILTAFSQRDLIEQARDAGALAYLVKPFQRSELIPALEVAIGRFREMKALHDQAQSLEDQLETRKVVDRAKGRLMDDHGLSEQDAFSFIQKTAMHERQTMKARRRAGHRRRARAAEPVNPAARDVPAHEDHADRRQLADLPGLLRPAHRPHHRQRAGHQRRVRVHLDADQPGARPPARPHRGHLRPARADVPPRGGRHLQGQPRGRARHPAPADGPGPPGGRGPRAADRREGRLRGRRHHRHPGHPGPRRRRRRAHRHRRPRQLPARRGPARQGALQQARRVRLRPLRRGRHPRAHRRPPVALRAPTPPCAATRPTTCPVCPGWGRRRRPSSSPPTAASTGSSPTSTTRPRSCARTSSTTRPRPAATPR